MYFDRFDICAAYYLFGSVYNNGQGSKEYAYMGRALNCGFRPSPLLSFDNLNENELAIYMKLVDRYWFPKRG